MMCSTEQRRLVIGKRNQARVAEPFIQEAQLVQLAFLIERHRERHFHLATPLGTRALLFELRDAFAEPPRHAVARHLQGDDMRHLVPERRFPAELARRPRAWRIKRHDTSETRAERAEETWKAERAHGEVVVLREHLDEDGARSA
jgi:hypothetical protein